MGLGVAAERSAGAASSRDLTSREQQQCKPTQPPAAQATVRPRAVRLQDPGGGVRHPAADLFASRRGLRSAGAGGAIDRPDLPRHIGAVAGRL